MDTPNVTVEKRKNYWSLDFAKFLCALTIISAHFASEWASFPTVVDYAFSIYVIAVPFFFCCSGFLFFKKLLSIEDPQEKWRYFIKYEKRIWIMYGLWTLVYFPFILVSWIRSGEFVVRLLNFIHSALVFQTYATLWFLPALAVGIAIIYFLVYRLSWRKMLVVSVLLYIFGMLAYTYYFVVDGTPIADFYDAFVKIFKTTRNGAFNGAPFIFMGYTIAAREREPSKSAFIKYGALAIASLLAVVAESFLLKFKFNVTGMDFGIFLVPFTYFFMMTVLNLELKERKIWLWCRKLSLLMFTSQRLFLSALPSVLPTLFGVIYSNSYVGLVAVITLTCAFSAVLILLSNKVKFLKRMI